MHWHRRILVACLSLFWAGLAAADSPAEQVQAARADLAKQEAALVENERLLQLAQARPAGPKRDTLIALANAARTQQRTAVAQAQARLDTLLGCSKLQAQVQRDLAIVDQQQAQIAAAQGELARWTQENDQAAKQACDVAANALADGILGRFIESFSAGISEAEASLRSQQPLPRFDASTREYIAGLRQRIDVLKAKRDGLHLAQARDSAVDLWQLLHEVADVGKKTGAEISDLTLKLAKNDATRLVVERLALLAAANDFERRILAAKFPLVGDAVQLGSLLVDYGYQAVRFAESRQRILQNYQISEQQIAAVEAVGCQLQRDLARLHACRGTPAPAQSTRCRRATP